MRQFVPIQNGFLSNSSIAELLASEGEAAQFPLQKAFRRAARRAFLGPEEAAQLVKEYRSLTELPAVGPYLEKVIRRWIELPLPSQNRLKSAVVFSQCLKPARCLPRNLHG
jgi:hypothetical protein